MKPGPSGLQSQMWWGFIFPVWFRLPGLPCMWVYLSSIPAPLASLPPTDVPWVCLAPDHLCPSALFRVVSSLHLTVENLLCSSSGCFLDVKGCFVYLFLIYIDFKVRTNTKMEFLVLTGSYSILLKSLNSILQPVTSKLSYRYEDFKCLQL